MKIKLLKLQLKQNAALAIPLIRLAQLNRFKYQNDYNWNKNKDEYKYFSNQNKAKTPQKSQSHIKNTKTKTERPQISTCIVFFSLLFLNRTMTHTFILV